MFKALTAAAALLSLSLNAGAAPERPVTLTTGLMWVIGDGNYYVCTAVNASATPLPVTLDLITQGGAVVDTQTSTLAPGQASWMARGAAVASYCRATFLGTPGSVRAGICGYLNGNCMSNLEAR